MPTERSEKQRQDGAGGDGCPAGRILVMENHDQAYRFWKDAGLKDRLVVHVDAHHDLGWIPDGGAVTIANFLCAALQEGVVREVCWVVPDGSWRPARSQKAIVRHLKALQRKYPGPQAPIRRDERCISTRLMGARLHVYPLACLPELNEPVLLDIDVDFMMIPQVAYGEFDQHAALPWCWPKQLVDRLGQSGLRAEAVTIARSVEGGYTPLKWKYLGDELALRLQGAAESDPVMAGMAQVQAAALALRAGDVQRAEQNYLAAVRLAPEFAAPHLHLAHLYRDHHRTDEARGCYQHALLLDPSYRTPYNSMGLWRYQEHRYRESREEYLRVLDLDPEDAHAHLGLGLLASRERRWPEAEGLLRRALALRANRVEGYRALGDVLHRQGRLEAAIEAHECSLAAVLAGHRDLAEPIATPAQGQLLDMNHCRVHAHIAWLYQRKGAVLEAISRYRISLAGGYDRLWLRLRLASLYCGKGQWRDALGELRAAMLTLPLELKRAVVWTRREANWAIRSLRLQLDRRKT